MTSHENRLLSLAAGTILDVSPSDAVDVADKAGFRAVGIWFDPDQWTSETTRETKRRLDATGVTALDVEPIIVGRGDQHNERLIDVAAELDARFVLVASGGAKHEAVAERLRHLSEHAHRCNPDLTLVLEFLPIFSVSNVDDACNIASAVGKPNVGVLIDSLHLDRSNATPADVSRYPAALFPYLQIADAPTMPPSQSSDELRDEALHGRLLPGDGALPLQELLDAIPDVALSFELRSRTLMATHADPVQRAKAAFDSGRRLISDSKFSSSK